MTKKNDDDFSAGLIGQIASPLVETGAHPNIHGIGPDTDGGPNLFYVPPAGSEALPIKAGTLGVPLERRRDPRPEDFADPRFEVIWELIKRVDVDFRNGLFSGATGNDVCAVLDALDTSLSPGGSPAEHDDHSAALLPVDPSASPAITEALPITFERFSAVNRERCESPQGFHHTLASWSTSDWFTAIMGEFGEAANIAKKLNRVRDGIPGNKESAAQLRDKLRRELGDVFVYLDLLAQALGFTIGAAAVDVFNAKSDEIGCAIKIIGSGTDSLSEASASPGRSAAPKSSSPASSSSLAAPAELTWLLCKSCGARVLPDPPVVTLRRHDQEKDHARLVEPQPLAPLPNAATTEKGSD